MRYGSLCSGIAGLDLAVEAVFDVTPVWFCEADPDATSVLERHWSGVPVLGDARTQDWRDVEPVDLVCAGYPCQPFSLAGRRGGADDPRHLWPYVIAAVRVLRPSVVVLENVAGHLGFGFDTVLGELAEAGFDAEWATIRASDVGACHRRERLFVVATDADARGRRAVTSDPGGGPGARRSPQPGRGPEGRATPRGVGKDLSPDADVPGLQDGLPTGAGSAGESGLAAAKRRGPVPTDADAVGRGERSRLRPSPGDGGRGRPTDEHGPTDWGPYADAIARWEFVLGRPAPAPTDGRGRLAVPFVEWMMGFPENWVAGLRRSAALRCLGNAVVPQQGITALAGLVGP